MVIYFSIYLGMTIIIDNLWSPELSQGWENIDTKTYKPELSKGRENIVTKTYTAALASWDMYGYVRIVMHMAVT